MLVAVAFKNRPGWWQKAAIFLVCSVLCDAQRYSFKHYEQNSGLTNLSVNTINQDKDGYLWVATDNGLFRYNGLRFERFGREEGLPQDDVTALAVSPGGAVWAGTPAGVAYRSADRFHPIELGAGQDGWSFGRLVAAEGNTAYASTSHGLIKLTLEKGFVSVKTIYVGETFAIGVEPGGTVWFGCGRDLCRLTGQEVTNPGARLGLPQDRWRSAVSDAQGTLWLCSETHMYKLLRGASSFVECSKDLPLARAPASEMRADAIYGVMLPTNEGLAIRRGDGWRIIGEREGLASDSVGAAFRDREGSLWIGMRGSGVDRWIGEGQWENWTKAEGLLADTLWGLAKDPKEPRKNNFTF
jgi:ligand-binding sensor domain-containing protein